MSSKLFRNEFQGKKRMFVEFFYINVGIFLSAFGVHFFRTPNKFALGGVTGIALLLTNIFQNLTSGPILIILNTFILLLGYILLGKKVAAKSLYGSFAFSAMVWVLEIFFPMTSPLSNQAFMELIYSVFIPGIGSAIVFNYGATTGGTDILAKILSKYFKFKIGTSLLVTDFLIALSAGLIFGIEACLFSVMGVFIKSFVIDMFLESLKTNKIFVIISHESEKIKRYIVDDLKRGATISKSTGAFTVQEKEVITTVVNRKQAVMLQNFLKTIDSSAFVTITNSTEIIGKGFQTFE